MTAGCRSLDELIRLQMSDSASRVQLRSRVLIADDHPLYRDGLRVWLERQADLEICGEAEDAAEVLKKVKELHPDLLLLDLRLRGEDGFELIGLLRAEWPDLRILILSQSDEMLFGEHVLRAGAQGYIMKDQSASELLQAIRTVVRDEIYTSEKLAALLLRRIYFGKPTDGAPSKLSVRELQVFELLGEGYSSREAASKLKLGLKTIETHRENIKRKLGLADAPSLVHAAITWVQNQSSLPQGGSASSIASATEHKVQMSDVASMASAEAHPA